MATWEKTRRLVRGCSWWEDKERFLCPIFNDCCQVCMHPDAPCEPSGERRYFTLVDEIPEECPLREEPLFVGVV